MRLLSSRRLYRLSLTSWVADSTGLVETVEVGSLEVGSLESTEVGLLESLSLESVEETLESPALVLKHSADSFESGGVARILDDVFSFATFSSTLWNRDSKSFSPIR